MDFFTSAVLGGLLYDALKIGLPSLDTIKSILTPYSIGDTECKIIEDELKHFDTSVDFSKEELIAYLERNSQISSIIKSTSSQINNIGTVNGPVINTNSGTMTFNFGNKD